MDILIGVCRAALIITWRRVTSVRTLAIRIRALKDESGKLNSTHANVKKMVDVSRQHLKKIDVAVEDWINKVAVMRREVAELLEKGEEVAEKGCCPPNNICPSFDLGEEIARKIEEVRELISQVQEFKFRIDPTPPLPDTPKPIELFEAQELVFSRVWSCLTDPIPGVIGIVGKAGIGKTVVLRKVGEELLKKKLDFDVVISVRVSSQPDLNRIQNEIGKCLGKVDHAWENKSLREKSRDISSILSDRKFALLLDDVSVGFDLQKVGVPIPQPEGQENNSKVVLATPFMKVFDEMNVRDDGKFVLEALAPEEAWKLFLKTVGVETFNSQTLTALARNAVADCGGVPLALVMIGRVMVGKRTSESQWEDKLRRLRDHQPKPNSKRHLSSLLNAYEGLEDSVTRSCFRYCSLLPVVDRDQLIDYWIGKGLLEEEESGGNNNEARYLGYSIIDVLKRSSFLRVEGNSVMMRDLVHEFALDMAKRNGEKFLVPMGSFFTETLEAATEWNEAHGISLAYKGIEKFPAGELESPHLTTLILFKSGLKTIPNGFFNSMPSLRVLDLSWCKMGENTTLEIVNYLPELQYLSLSHTNVTKLPVEIKELVNLKVLDLSNTAELNAIPQGMISALSRLMVLNTYCCGYEDWIAEEGDMLVGSVSFLDELRSLKFLNHLGVSIKDALAMEELQHDSWNQVQSSTHSLSIMRCKGLTHLQLPPQNFMVGLRMLAILNCSDLVVIQINQLVADNNPSVWLRDVKFYSLQYVTIEGCWSLAKLTWLTLVPNLEILEISKCMNLEVLVDTERDGTSSSTKDMFPRLKRMSLSYLPSLGCITMTAMPFCALEEIRVSYCPKLVELPIATTRITQTLKLIEGQRKWWDNLEWKEESIKEALVPHFKEIQY